VAAGEHRFLRVESYVEYRRARVERGDHLIKCVAGWLFRPHDPVADALFERVCAGILKSAFTPRWIKTYYAIQLKRRRDR